MANRWSGITIDCADPASLAEFWSILLGRPLSAEHDGPPAGRQSAPGSTSYPG